MKTCLRCGSAYLPADVPLRSRLCVACWDVGTFQYVKRRYAVALAAVNKVQSAIRRGLLPRLSYRFDAGIPCVDCGKPAQQWDHRDYSKPLAVEACCASCNQRRGPGLNDGVDRKGSKNA